MKFKLGFNDCEPGVLVEEIDGELVVTFEGFSDDEAERWQNSNDVMSSFKVWHQVMGNFEMVYKQLNQKEI